MRDSAAVQPLAGVHVSLVEGTVTKGVDTNAQGRYEIPDLLTGTFDVQFSKWLQLPSAHRFDDG